MIGPLLLFTCQGVLNLKLPSWLTSEDAALLEGNRDKTQITEVLSIKDIIEGKFQSALEQEITGYIPARASAIVENAKIQRSFISTSNMLFQWDCYPTFFSSERIYIPAFNAVSYIPSKILQSLKPNWSLFASGIKSVAEYYPNKHFVLYVVQGYGETSWNPAYELISYPFSTSLCQETMSEVLKDTENVSILTKAYYDGEEFYDNFFTTDHHWNIRGAWNACDQICTELEIKPPRQSSYKEIESLKYTGATARYGLDLIEETIFDSTNTFDTLNMETSNGTVINCSDHNSFWKLPPLRQRYTFYDSYYDAIGEGTITGGIGNQTGLLIGNSFKGAIQRPLALAFKSLITRADLHPSRDIEETLQELIESSNVDDIIFVANPGNYNIDQAFFNLSFSH